MLASWGAGHELVERVLGAEDAHVVTGAVLLGSGPGNQRVNPFTDLARRAMRSSSLLWVGQGGASLTTWTADLLRDAGAVDAHPSASTTVTSGLLRAQAFQRAGWQQELIADALVAWVRAADTARRPRPDVEAIRLAHEGEENR